MFLGVRLELVQCREEPGLRTKVFEATHRDVEFSVIEFDYTNRTYYHGAVYLKKLGCVERVAIQGEALSDVEETIRRKLRVGHEYRRLQLNASSHILHVVGATPDQKPHWRTVCVDFDGVICGHAEWRGADVVNGVPVPGAFAFLVRVHLAGYKILIHTARLAAPIHEHNTIITALEGWFYEHGLDDDVIEALDYHTGHAKPFAKLYVDDRAYRFEGTWPDLNDIEKKPWDAEHDYINDRELLSKT